jgi:hypothetical protein
MSDWQDQVRAWWGSGRVRLAFGIAPLAFPAMASLLMAFVQSWPSALFLAIVTFLFWLPISYIATLLVGVPVYRFLCTRNFTAFWMAPAAGFISGTAVIIVSYFLVMVILRLHLSPMDKDTTILTVLPGALLMGGLPGAASGAIIWLIARPDRQSAGAATVKNS